MARRLTHLCVPTIVLHGTPDRLILVDNGSQLAGLINAPRYAELPGVGDLAPYQARFAESVEHTDEVEAIGNEGAP
jgi:hypothetical protein